jgi:peroxiredoxin Q/BCP
MSLCFRVLYFYPGDFTEGCTIEAKGFQAKAEEFSALKAQIVGISVDSGRWVGSLRSLFVTRGWRATGVPRSVEKHLDFEKTYGLSFPLLSDKDGAVSTAYGSVLKIPFLGTFSNRKTYLIDPTGNLRFVFTDVDSRVKKHADDVLAKLAELTAWISSNYRDWLT